MYVKAIHCRKQNAKVRQARLSGGVRIQNVCDDAHGARPYSSEELIRGRFASIPNVDEGDTAWSGKELPRDGLTRAGKPDAMDNRGEARSQG